MTLPLMADSGRCAALPAASCPSADRSSGLEGQWDASVVPSEASTRIALLLWLGLGLTACAWIPGDLPSYERFALPKELVVLACGVVGWSAVGAKEAATARSASLALVATIFLAGLLSGASNGWVVLRATSFLVSLALIHGLAEHAATPLGTLSVSRAASVVFGGSAALVLLEGVGALPAISLPGRGPGALLGNRNFAAHFLAIGLPLMCGIASGTLDRRSRRLAAASAALSVAAIITARTRAAWIALALSGVLVLLVRSWRPIPRAQSDVVRTMLSVVGAGALLGVAVSALGWGGLDPLGQTFQRLGDYSHGTGAGRAQQYLATLRLVRDHAWWGVGAGHWSLAYPAVAQVGDQTYAPGALPPMPRLPSSDWLGLTAEYGVLGALAFAAVVWRLVRQALRKVNFADHRGAGMVLLATIAVLLVLGFLDSVAFLPQGGFAAALVLGSVGGRSTAAAAHPLSIRANRAFAGFAAPLLVVMLLGDLSRTIAAVAVRTRRFDPRQGVAAAVLDPGSHRLSSLAALRLAQAGRCEEARRWVGRAHAAAPLYAQNSVALRLCDSTRLVPAGGESHVSDRVRKAARLPRTLSRR